MNEPLPITPATKVAALLDSYPELEEVLIAMAPPFKKLRNPILRKSVAKVASLKQAAAVGRLPVDVMVNQLRRAVGLGALDGTDGQEQSYFSTRPAWFDKERVVQTITESELDPDVMPLGPLMARVKKLADGEILQLVTTFLPAPGIDIMRAKGFRCWVSEDGDVVRTYFTGAAQTDE